MSGAQLWWKAPAGLMKWDWHGPEEGRAQQARGRASQGSLRRGPTRVPGRPRRRDRAPAQRGAAEPRAKQQPQPHSEDRSLAGHISGHLSTASFRQRFRINFLLQERRLRPQTGGTSKATRTARPGPELRTRAPSPHTLSLSLDIRGAAHLSRTGSASWDPQPSWGSKDHLPRFADTLFLPHACLRSTPLHPLLTEDT